MITPSYANLTATTAQPISVQPSFQLPPPLYNSPPVLRGQQAQLPMMSRPTSPPSRLAKRQVVVAIEVVTVVTVLPVIPQATPVTVTVTVPPPANTDLSSGGWPIINPGSAAACWADTACNSVCPNFQQNGWYAHCVDAACTQCRCQIISSQMCTGPAYRNATWSSDAPARTATLAPAIATVTVMVGSEAASLVAQHRSSTKTKLLSLLAIVLVSWVSF
ncbi:hypothetical protein CROQUDRAFT_670147 [Cronartium quercuum f. sp. fusiforme G11]|uniref:Uncharacterized protein n=1 Tax=Cronartium quercuum f. sp. fusiforme G11 TaxID=708437 RepID=A0A9P6NPT5_9BASI|nr:hypothetical protein CROQUDRAFT_670147 [Cronartium quercuum f. sp. fusiforme G11]